MKNKIRKRDTGCDYTVVELGGRLLTDNLNDCFKVRCTNKVTLEEITKIPYNRLVYLFAKRHDSWVVENDHLIIKTGTVYKGKQPGGLRNLSVIRRGNVD